MQYALCRHIKTNGTQCQAPSLADGLWCFFHTRLHQRHSRFRPIEAVTRLPSSARQPFQSQRTRRPRLCSGSSLGRHQRTRLRPDGASASATALLYGLQIRLQQSLRASNSNPNPSKVVLSAEPTTGRSIHLAEPGAVCEVADTPETPLLWEGFEDDNEEEDEDDE